MDPVTPTDLSTVMNVLLDYSGLLVRLQTLQILGFILACSAVIVLCGSSAGNAVKKTKIYFYATTSLALLSVLMGIYPDLSAVFVKFSLHRDLSGVLAVGKPLFHLYLLQVGIAALALGVAVCSRCERLVAQRQ